MTASGRLYLYDSVECALLYVEVSSFFTKGTELQRDGSNTSSAKFKETISRNRISYTRNIPQRSYHVIRTVQRSTKSK